MTLKEKLQLLNQEWTSLVTKIKAKFQEKNNTITQKDQAITQITQQKNEVAQKLELQVRENTENEKVLEQLLKDFQDLGNSL